MITCRFCGELIGIQDIADPASYRGEEFATCASCATRVKYRTKPHEHRPNRRDQERVTRMATNKAGTGFKPGGPAATETWALCDRCLGYVEAHGAVRLKADGRMLRWLGTDLGHSARHVECDACGARRARRHAVLRVVLPEAMPR